MKSKAGGLLWLIALGSLTTALSESGHGLSRREDVGTKDAPVDGLDGKPHAGPFVDSTEAPPLNAAGITPEDGVMNDPNRTPPKKGTTGTEGGVSDKEGITDKRPEIKKNKLSKEETDTLAGSTDELEIKGLAGLDKPDDLPETPHNIPHPQTPTQSIPEDEESEEEDLIPWDSLFGSFSSIAATEIGDKTFIVAALMAMRHSRLQVFSAAFSALLVMTFLSGLAGHLVGAVISKRWSALVAALLFLVFGAKSLREGAEMSPDQGVSDEIREVEAELEEKEIDMARQAGHGNILPYHERDFRSGVMSPQSRSPSPARLVTSLAGIKNLFSLLLSPAWVETFSMTFFGELGDRSQIATVAMAAGQEYLWVMVGATLGHFVCTGVAVLGGSVLAGRVSLRKVTLVGGCIFIGFGLFTLLEAIQYTGN